MLEANTADGSLGSSMCLQIKGFLLITHMGYGGYPPKMGFTNTVG